MKKLIIILMMVFLSLNVFGTENYNNNEQVPIEATYTFAGVLTHANANLTVTFPNGSIDLEYSNFPIPELSNGVFSTVYNNTEVSGTYSALVVFYSDSWTELGRRTKLFTIGDENLTMFDVKKSSLELFVCPTNYVQISYLVGFFILAFIIYGIGLAQKNAMKPIFLFIGGFMMFVLPFYTITCNIILSMLIWVFGLAMMYSSVSLKY